MHCFFFAKVPRHSQGFGPLKCIPLFPYTVAQFVEGIAEAHPEIQAPGINHDLRCPAQVSKGKEWILNVRNKLRSQSTSIAMRERFVSYYYQRAGHNETYTVRVEATAQAHSDAALKNGLLLLGDLDPIAHNGVASYSKVLQYWVANGDPEAGILYVDPAVWGAVDRRGGDGVARLAKSDLGFGVFYPGMPASKLKARIFMVFIDNGQQCVGHWVWLTYVTGIGIFYGNNMGGDDPDITRKVLDSFTNVLKDLGVEKTDLKDNVSLYFVGGMPQQTDAVNCALYALASSTYIALVATSDGFALADGIKPPKWTSRHIKRWRSDFNVGVLFGPGVVCPPTWLLSKEGDWYFCCSQFHVVHNTYLRMCLHVIGRDGTQLDIQLLGTCKGLHVMTVKDMALKMKGCEHINVQEVVQIDDDDDDGEEIPVAFHTSPNWFLPSEHHKEEDKKDMVRFTLGENSRKDHFADLPEAVRLKVKNYTRDVSKWLPYEKNKEVHDSITNEDLKSLLGDSDGTSFLQLSCGDGLQFDVRCSVVEMDIVGRVFTLHMASSP